MCTCSIDRVARYRSKVSGPLLDRFDIHVHVPAVKVKEMSQKHDAESTESIRQRVMCAQQFSVERHVNTEVKSPASLIDQKATALLERAADRFGLSARAWNKAIRVGRSIADLDASECIGVEHVAEALHYRFVDRSQVASGMPPESHGVEVMTDN